MKYSSFGHSHIGRRLENEDALWHDEELGVFAVADGMGGHKGGALASRLTVESVADVFEQARTGLEVTWPLGLDSTVHFEESLVDLAVRTANRTICSQRSEEVKRMGSTVAILVLRDDKAIVGHVGDSRVYRLREGELELLTEDHSLYNELLQNGAPNLPPKSEFAMGNVITRALGRPNNAQPDVLVADVLEGDVYLLCTDGLSEVLSSDMIGAVLDSLPAEAASKMLVNAAFAEGSRDNITALVVRAERSVHRGAAASGVYDRALVSA